MDNSSLKHYNLLDLVRVFCACLVIFIHMGLPASFSLVPCLARQAVPFFFLVSGFFFEKNANKQKNIFSFACKYALSILMVYLVWALLWTPYFVKEVLENHATRSVLYRFVVVIRRVFLAGVAQYWYMLVLAEGVLLLGLILRFQAWKTGWVLCVLGIALRILYGLQPTDGIAAKIFRVFYVIFSWDCNVVMTGFPLLFLGAFFSRNEKLLQTFHRHIIGILYLVSVLLAFAIYGISYSHYGIPFWLIESILLFLFCILPFDVEAKIPPSLCKSARNLSSVIYLTHTVFLSLFGYVFHIWGTTIRFILCVLVACMLTWLIKRINWPPLNRLMMVK